MAFNDLDNHEMGNLFEPIVIDPKVKAQFLSIKEIAGLHEQVEEAYRAILAVQAPDETTDPILRQITLDEKPLDTRHDRVARAISLVLEAQREDALGQTPPDEERAQTCEATFATLFPEGTSILNASYRAEAGNTSRIALILEGEKGPALKAFLKTIPVYKKETALDRVLLWLDLGSQLAKLEAAKAARLAHLDSQPAPPARVVQQARSEWIDLATTLLNVLRRSKAPAATKNAIGHPLAHAATKAGKRPPAKSTSPAEGPTPDTSAPVDPTGKPAGG